MDRPRVRRRESAAIVTDVRATRGRRACGMEVLDRRQGVTRRLFARATPDTGRIATLREVLALGRPVATLIDEAHHTRLAATLGASTTVRRSFGTTGT